METIRLQTGPQPASVSLFPRSRWNRGKTQCVPMLEKNLLAIETPDNSCQLALKRI